MNEMNEKPYCTCDRRRNDGWTTGPNGTFVCPRCRKIAKRVWEVTQESCDSTGSISLECDTIDVAERGTNEMKEIKMSDHSEHGEGFTADNCPACGTSANLAQDPEIQPTMNAKPNPVEPLYVRIRSLRESLGLSRKDVQDATGLGASVVWRAEQEGKDVGDALITKIWDYLNACQKSGHVKVRKTRKETSTETAAVVMITEVEKVRDEWMAKTWELRGIIDTALELAQAKRAQAQDAKRSTKSWDELIDVLEPHATDRA
jgi:transcriptional regulator with XRE-family HTH domain